ncbi:E3 ubiquitin-protein ligase RNF180 isoform X1 [Diabrotica virgifera virgifera]|uniref:E3 ubiquitin-protein ligase RNF180-like n=1 Tax=Diabrotica virgifera virgifera TaxID=50390 RepID=A0ABM5IEZ4_DIAVI|nr:E3 ubiquitin-protein ligase RNF180 isoform X1 [Diabrotica virgifera virgifera]
MCRFCKTKTKNQILTGFHVRVPQSRKADSLMSDPDKNKRFDDDKIKDDEKDNEEGRKNDEIKLKNRMFQEIKCKKCRKTIFSPDQIKTNLILNAHGHPMDNSRVCDIDVEETNVFINDEHLPSWIKDRIEAEEWSKGRINCPNCDSRIGSFDYVSGQKCACFTNLLPPIHFIKSKIDLIKK